jgi:tRNA threonylcarbamoyladenosine biosynthesis protein TsaB
LKILGIDTSTKIATIAVIDEEKVLGEYTLNQEMSHSENLIPMIKELLNNLYIKIEDIDLYGVAIGPGSFTGLRIGVAAVKSLAHLFNKPIVGVSTLQGMAYNLPHNEIVIPMIDARRDRVYTGVYSWENGILKTIKADDVLEMEVLLDELKDYDTIVVNGDGSILYKDRLIHNLKDVKFSTKGQNICKATSICELALLKYNNGELDDFYTLAPEYLRETQAQRELNERK